MTTAAPTGPNAVPVSPRLLRTFDPRQDSEEALCALWRRLPSPLRGLACFVVSFPPPEGSTGGHTHWLRFMSPQATSAGPENYYVGSVMSVLPGLLGSSPRPFTPDE